MPPYNYENGNYCSNINNNENRPLIVKKNLKPLSNSSNKTNISIFDKNPNSSPTLEEEIKPLLNTINEKVDQKGYYCSNIEIKEKKPFFSNNSSQFLSNSLYKKNLPICESNSNQSPNLEQNIRSLLNSISLQNTILVVSEEMKLDDIIKKINEIAKEKDIKIKMFHVQLEELQNQLSDFYLYLFFISAKSLLKLMNASELPIMENKSYQTILGKNYIKRGETGFDHLDAYNQIIYEILPFFDMGTTNDVYIGHTEKDEKKRFEYHIDNALNNYAEKWEYPSRLIERAILIAISKEIPDLMKFIEDYQALPIDRRLIIRKKLADMLLNKYFVLNILEKHFTNEFVSEREKWYKEKYPNIYGTVYPYGLNMQSNYESVGKYVALPLYDIAFMISLGYRVPEISKKIIELYNIRDATDSNVYARISQFFGSVENAEDIFLKPIVQSILFKFPNLSGDQIGKSIHREGKQFFDSSGCPFKRWFGNVTLREVKKAISFNDFNWNNLKYFIEEIRAGNFIKGKHVFQWIELFIKGVSNEELAKFGGYGNADSFRKHFFNLSESKKAFGVPNRKTAVKKYQKQDTIIFLKNTTCISLATFEHLYTEIFGFQSRKDYLEKYNDYTNGNYLFERALKNYFEILFNGMKLEEIIEKYKE